MFVFFKDNFILLSVLFCVGLVFFVLDENSEVVGVSSGYKGNMVRFFNAEFTGEDGKGKEYVLKSKEAQNVNEEEYILNIVEMFYDFESKRDVKLNSHKGFFNKQTQVFTGTGDVKVDFQKQYFLFTEKLNTSLADRTIFTDDKVDVKSERAFVHSEGGIKVNIDKKIIEFNGPVYSKFIEF